MSLLHQDDDLEPDTTERELTLSTGAIFAIFAGLVLLCAVFFGFGYMVRGRQAPAPILATVAPESAPTAGANFNTFKPAAGSPAGSATPVKSATPPPTPAPPPELPSEEMPPATHPAAPAEAAPLIHATPARPTPPPVNTRPLASVVAPPAVVPAGSFIVQVAAVSHEEDAGMMVNALKAKGYPAAARNEPQDKLLHIQIGPYPTRQAADAIKQRLSADGYNNPIVK